MNLPLSRCFAVILVCIALTGCQGLPALQKSSLTETELFAKGLDQYSATGELQTLQRLPKEYPDGAWARRAESVAKLAEQQEQCVAEKESLADAKAGEQKQQPFEADKELDRCQTDMATLKQNNLELEETIARLKKLLIDMESRSN